jgi:hypothetical protein
MEILLSPKRGDKPISLEKRGTTLMVNGEPFDFGFLTEGDNLPRDAVSGDWLASDVTRRDGVLRLTVALAHGANAPQETRFPAPVTLSSDGPVELPPFDAPEVSE